MPQRTKKTSTDNQEVIEKLKFKTNFALAMIAIISFALTVQVHPDWFAKTALSEYKPGNCFSNADEPTLISRIDSIIPDQTSTYRGDDTVNYSAADNADYALNVNTYTRTLDSFKLRYKKQVSCSHYSDLVNTIQFRQLEKRNTELSYKFDAFVQFLSNRLHFDKQ